MNYNYIITGAMGSGKSTVLKILSKKKLLVVDEPARQILLEQRSISGNGVPEKDPLLFTQLLLSRAIYQYKCMQHSTMPILFDRGIPDNIAYARLFGIDLPAAENAAQLIRYNTSVFIFPPWEEIYTTDDERKMSFLDAKVFGDEIKIIYASLGYRLIEVPRINSQLRAQFILDNLK